MAAPTEFKPIIVGFLCNWCCYGGADLAGVSRFSTRRICASFA